MTPETRQAVDLGRIRSALADEFGLRVNDLAAIDAGEPGDMAQVFGGTCEGHRIIVKTQDDPAALRIETLALELLAQHGLPCPRPLGYAEKTRHLDRPMVIQTALPGIPLSRLVPTDSTLGIYEAAGSLLKSLHKIKLTGFGALRENDGTLQGSSETWSEAAAGFGRSIDHLVEHGFVDRPDVAVLEEALEMRAQA